jgi:Uma2 family endonuclease
VSSSSGINGRPRENSSVTIVDPFLSPEDYLRIERDAESRSEYLRGRTFSMAGASWRHALIVNNIAGELGLRFKERDCYVASSDLRVNVAATGLYTYPDVVALCQLPQLGPSDTLLNPQLLVEVLSPSSEAYDRGAKFGHYRRLESLSDYVLVSQDRILVEHYTRQPNGLWLYEASSDLWDILRLPELDCQVPLAEIYAKVSFEEV